MLTDDEVACIKEDAGDEESYRTFLDLPSLTFLHLPPFLPTCIGLNRAVDLTSAVLSEAAGLPGDAESCIREYVAAQFASTTEAHLGYEEDFECLPRGLSHFDSTLDVDLTLSDVRISEWVDMLTDDEVSCIYESRPEALALMSRDDLIEVLRERSPFDLSEVDIQAPGCVDSKELADIATTALIAQVSNIDLAAEIENCVREAIGEEYEDPPDPIVRFMGPPIYYSCLTREQIARLSTSELIAEMGGVTEDQQACFHEKTRDSLEVADELRSGNPQDTIAITNAFAAASIYVCLPDQKIVDFFASQLPDDESLSIDNVALVEAIHCARDLLGGRFVELYKEEVGPKMFGQQGNLTEEERQAVNDFWESFSACDPEQG